MKCPRKLSLILLSVLFCSYHCWATSPSFAPVYTTLDKLDSQVQELNLNLAAQQALSLQLQAQLSKSQQDLTASQQNLEIANQQLEQSKTTLNQASKDVETLNRQLKSSELKLKCWRTTAIIAVPVAAAAIVVICVNRH